MVKCPECQVGELVKDDHNFEQLDVCPNCGFSITSATAHLVNDHCYYFDSPHKRLRLSVASTSSSTARLSQSTSSRSSAARKSCLALLQSFMGKIGVSTKSSVAAEAKAIVEALPMEGRGFKHEAVASAAIFIAFRSHNSDTSLKALIQRLNVDLNNTNRVLKLVTKTKPEVVKPPNLDDPSPLTSMLLTKCEFWTPDGSSIDNQVIIKRVNHLIPVLMAIPKPSVTLTKELVLATALAIYKSDNLNLRAKKSVADLASECGLSLEYRIAQSWEIVIRSLRLLVQELPFLTTPLPKTAKSKTILKYLKDVEQHSETLMAKVKQNQVSVVGHNPTPRADERPRDGTASDEVIDEDEIDSYIRTEAEIKMIRPLYERLHDQSV